MRIRISITTAYHAQSDDQSERINQTAEIAMCYASEQASDVDFIKFLSAMKHIFNNSINASISQFSNEIIYDFNLTDSFNIVAEEDTKNFEAECKIHQQETQNLIT